MSNAASVVDNDQSATPQAHPTAADAAASHTTPSVDALGDEMFDLQALGAALPPTPPATAAAPPATVLPADVTDSTEDPVVTAVSARQGEIDLTASPSATNVEAQIKQMQATVAPVPAPAPVYDGSPRSIRKEIEKLEAKLQKYEAEMEEYKTQAKDETRPQKEREAARADLRVSQQQILAKEQQLAAERQRLATAEQAAAARQVPTSHQRRLDFLARLATFLAAIPDSDIVADAVLRLPNDDINDLPTPDIQRGFLIRQCYLDLINLMKYGQQIYILTGTPGIGKTAFLLLWLRILLRTGRKVMFEIFRFVNDRPHCILFTPSKSADGSIAVSTMYSTMAAEDIAYLSDCNDPIHKAYDGFVVIASSPAVMRSTIAKHYGRNMYMPLWDEAEVTALHAWRKAKLTWYAADDEDIRSNYERWGGVARYLFTTAADSAEKMKQALNDAMDETKSAKAMLEAMGRVMSSGSAVDRLCHLVVKQYVDDVPTRRVASGLVITDLVQIYYASQRSSMYEAVQEMMYKRDAASFLCKLYEEVNNTTFTPPDPFTTRSFKMEDLEAGAAAADWGAQVPSLVERIKNIDTLQPRLPTVERAGAGGSASTTHSTTTDTAGPTRATSSQVTRSVSLKANSESSSAKTHSA